MNFLPLLTIPIFFLLAVFAKPLVAKRWNLCAICVAVSLSWIVLLIFYWRDALQDATAIAVLMGMSVTGLMYKLERMYRSAQLRHLWLARLIVILGGFLMIMLLLQNQWREFIVVAIGSLLFLSIISFLMQGTTRPEKSVFKKLDNCC